MIDDAHRGYLMEIMASKLLVLERHVQLVGMSATLTVKSHIVNVVVLADSIRIQRYWPIG